MVLCCQVYYSNCTASTNYQSMSGLTIESDFSQFCGLLDARPSAQHGGVILRLRLPACQWPSSYHELTWPLLSVCAQREKALCTSSYKSTNAIRPGVHLHASSNPDHLTKARLQVPTHWELGLQTMNWGKGAGHKFSVHGKYSKRLIREVAMSRETDSSAGSQKPESEV